MDPDTHALCLACAKCPNAHRRLQRLTTVAERTAFVRAHYVPLFDAVVTTSRHSFTYRYGQWYTRRVRLRVHLDTVAMRASFQVRTQIDDDQYVDRETTLVNERRVVPSALVARVEQALRAHDTGTADEVARALSAVKGALHRKTAAVNRRVDLTLIRASRGRLPPGVRAIVGAYVGLQ